MHPLARLDQRFLWHPFTQMRDWLKGEPIVIVRGKGAELEDANGRRYLDANASIWTNLHGHRHPALDRAVKAQLGKVAHSSALGLANEPAAVLAEKLVAAANRPRLPGQPKLAKVFLSDDGSTAMEVALKLAYEFARRSGRSAQPRFLSLRGAYHGDTVGAVSVGHIDLFHKAYAGLLFKTDAVMAPYCYRCPFNRARAERADAREYRKCNWECVGKVEQAFARRTRRAEGAGASAGARANAGDGAGYAAMVVEPLMQGAAGMIPQPVGWLRRVAEIARGHGAQLIADEVMTGFGRTGAGGGAGLFACGREGVRPDYLVLAKGLTGGYLPMAATVVTRTIFDAFLGEYGEFKTFFHGHSFTGNQLGAAAANASMELLATEESVRRRGELEGELRAALAGLWKLENVGDIRQVGLVAGVELVRNWRTREAFALAERAGIRVCEAMARRGVLTRPIGNVVVVMPPYCTTARQVATMVRMLEEAIGEVLGGGAGG
ncbi:adenosylmethionine-8-amino-7-oxononanoate aminotransferase [Verrucomicrobiota bacterium]|nr:adenosylmethionine-8-amino-7-oxononanoate aminotransferase [Verrucomicrobiota bacterium]